MESLIKFVTEYENLKAQLPGVYMNVKQIRNGSRWRVEVFNADPESGDLVLLHAEDENRESVFEKALKKIKEIPDHINEPKGYTLNGQKVYRRA